MGVNSCDRRDCDNIMCGRLSNEYGYICDDCFEELVATGPGTDVEMFMALKKQQNREEKARARYNITFKIMNP